MRTALRGLALMSMAALALPAVAMAAPVIDEFSHFLRDPAVENDGRTAAPGGHAVRRDCQEVMAELDAAIARRIALLERAEAMLLEAAAERHVTVENLLRAIVQAQAIRDAALGTAMEALADIELSAPGNADMRELVAALEERGERIDAAIRTIERAISTARPDQPG